LFYLLILYKLEVIYRYYKEVYLEILKIKFKSQNENDVIFDKNSIDKDEINNHLLDPKNKGKLQYTFYMIFKNKK